MKTKEKDECSYSFSNAIRTLVMEHRNTIDANFLLRIISICNLGLMLKVVFTWF